MAPCVLRRNRRNHHRTRSRKLFLIVAALAFALSGILHFSWAIETYSEQQAALAKQEKPATSKSLPRPYDGALIGKNETESQGSPLDEESSAEAIEPLEETSVTLNDSVSGALSESAPPTPAQPQAAPSQATQIHHTKYREKPVYRIVHHQASVAREVSENGRPRIEWSLCPVCSKRHEAAYNERILDRVDQVFCSACGERHSADFDETIYE